MPMTMDERVEMLQRASKGWLELTRVIDRIPTAALVRPNSIGTWSGKDLLAHLANWEEVALDIVAEMEDGSPEAWPEGDNDEINEEMLAPYRDSALAEVREYLEATHFQLMDAAERARNVTPRIVLEVTSEHYAIHIDDLKSLLKPGG
jgi:hypothetical protein